MYFYHEHYHDADDAALEEAGSRDPRDDGRACEHIRSPGILHWLVMGVALCVLLAAIHGLG